MSSEIVDTILFGYEKQVYPKMLIYLNQIYNQFYFTRPILEEIGRNVDGFRQRRPSSEDASEEGYLGSHMTTDGYFYYCSLEFEIPGFSGNSPGKCAVLFPWMMDSCNKDGLQLDRSIAVFADRSSGKAEVYDILEKLHNSMLDYTKKEFIEPVITVRQDEPDIGQILEQSL